MSTTATVAAARTPEQPGGVDLVNAALLGTDRRPLGGSGGADPAAVLLDLAARRRAQLLVAVGLEECPPFSTGPPGSSAEPPLPARELLDQVLLRPSALLVNLWLGEAVAHGTGLAPEHWTPVLDLARRQPELDRSRLAVALGEGGRWFAGQNPRWLRVLQSLPIGEPTPRGPATDRGVGVVDLDVLRAEPDRLFAVPDPWAETTCQDALALLGEGRLPGRAAQAYGAAVGARLPLQRYPLVGQAFERYLPAAGAGDRAPAWGVADPTRASARTGLVAVDDVVWTRLLIARAFDPSQVLPERGEVPSR